MDLLARGRRLLLSLALALAACGAPRGGPVGTSDAPRLGAADAGARPSAGAPSPVPAGFHAEYTRLAERFASSGHFVGRYDAIVWGNAAAKAAWDARGAMPDGAQLVAEHLRRGTDDRGPLLVMDRRAGAWTFTMVTSDGRVMDGAAACGACHAMAPTDGVFR